MTDAFPQQELKTSSSPRSNIFSLSSESIHCIRNPKKNPIRFTIIFVLVIFVLFLYFGDADHDGDTDIEDAYNIIDTNDDGKIDLQEGIIATTTVGSAYLFYTIVGLGIFVWVMNHYIHVQRKKDVAALQPTMINARRKNLNGQDIENVCNQELVELDALLDEAEQLETTSSNNNNLHNKLLDFMNRSRELIEARRVNAQQEQQNAVNDVKSATESLASRSNLATIDTSEIKVVKKLGAGTFGTVYLANWHGSKVAVKTCKSGKVLTEKLKKKFLQEARILSLLSHDNCGMFRGLCLNLEDINENNDPVTYPLALVIEFFPKGDLKEFLYHKDNNAARGFVRNTARLVPFKSKMQIVLGLAAGMEYLHTLPPPIIHRDLKPDNVMIVEKDGMICPKVIDFGEVTQQVKVAKSNVGTPGYIPPEIYQREKHGRAVDVFAFGILINEIFLQEEPFHELQQNLRERVWDKNDTYSASDWVSDVPTLIQENIVDGNRPPLAERLAFDDEFEDSEFDFPKNDFNQLEHLIQNCWKQEATERPTFTEILNTLKCYGEFA